MVIAEPETSYAVQLLSEFVPKDRLPLGRFQDVVTTVDTLLAVADGFANGDPPPLGTEPIHTHHHVDVKFVHFGSPLHLHLEIWHMFVPALPVLYVMARRIATFPDRVRTDRAKLRAEAATWRAAQTTATLAELEAWENELKRRLAWRDLTSLEIRITGDEIVETDDAPPEP